MSRLTVVLLFSKNQSKEPPAILQCSVSGEYINYSFDDWRDAVHYLFWCSYNKFNPRNDSNFDTWREFYGYLEEEEFVGDRNEFINRSDEVTVFTSFSLFSNSVDLASFSVWRHNDPDYE